MAIPEAIFGVVKGRAKLISEVLPAAGSVRKKLKTIRNESYQRLSEDGYGIGPFPIWFDRQKAKLAWYEKERRMKELMMWIVFIRENLIERDKASEKLVKAKLSLGLGLRVPKRLLIKNVKRLKHVVKKGRVKNLGFLKKRSALLFSVEKRYLLADEGVTYQVANICLYVDLLRDSLCTVPIQRMEDFIALEIIHAVRPFTEKVHILCNSDALLTLIEKRAGAIVLPFTTDSKHGGFGRSQVKK